MFSTYLKKTCMVPKSLKMFPKKFEKTSFGDVKHTEKCKWSKKVVQTLKMCSKKIECHSGEKTNVSKDAKMMSKFAEGLCLGTFPQFLEINFKPKKFRT